jgi:hypothetical protein
MANDDSSSPVDPPRRLNTRLARAESARPGPRRARSWEIREQREELEHTYAASLINQLAAAVGGIASSMIAADVDAVLFSGSGMIPNNGDGFYTREWPKPCAAIAIANLSSNQLIVAGGGGGATDGTPGRGAGTFWIAAGLMRVMALRDNAITIFGPGGSVFDLTVYSRPQTPFSGLCGSAE